MPTSFHKHISYVMDKVIECKPESVLDIGTGFGKWGFLCREYLDIYGKGSQYKKEDWKTKIYGVEIFTPYLEEFTHLNHIYTKIWNCPIDTFNFEFMDCIMIMDVLEHIDKEEAMKLMYKCLENSKRLILSIPLGDFRYTFKGENKYESHLSVWTEEELGKNGYFGKNYKEHKLYDLTTTGGKKLKVGVFIYDKKD